MYEHLQLELTARLRSKQSGMEERCQDNTSSNNVPPASHGLQASHPGIEIVIRWTPGMKESQEIERANEEAKWVQRASQVTKGCYPEGAGQDLLQSQLAARQTHAKENQRKGKEMV